MTTVERVRNGRTPWQFVGAIFVCRDSVRGSDRRAADANCPRSCWMQMMMVKSAMGEEQAVKHLTATRNTAHMPVREKKINDFKIHTDVEKVDLTTKYIIVDQHLSYNSK